MKRGTRQLVGSIGLYVGVWFDEKYFIRGIRKRTCDAYDLGTLRNTRANTKGIL